MISANTFQWTLCPLGHFLALIVQCRIHGTSFESLMEALSRSLFWNHFFVFFFWPSTGFDEGHIFSGDHIKSLWKIAAVNSMIRFFVIHRSWIAYQHCIYDMRRCDYLMTVLTLGTLDRVREWKQSSWGVLRRGLWSRRRHLHRDGEHGAKRHQEATQKLQHFTCKAMSIQSVSQSLPRHCRRVPATRRALPTLCEHARAWLVSTD